MSATALYSRGACRILDLREQERPRPWLVVDTAGAWLHDDVSFEAARDWADRREMPGSASPAPVRPMSRGPR